MLPSLYPTELSQLVGDPTRVTHSARRARPSFPRLLLVLPRFCVRQLVAKIADVVVQPNSVEEILAVLSLRASSPPIPVTVRGAGTGNYGQCVPLEGGIVLDLSLMDKLEGITAEGVAICQPGLRLGVLETEARKKGWELPHVPGSTLAKASVGGFLGGGSGGIGSVAHGALRDFDNVQAFEVVTMEDSPRVVMHKGEAVHEILHAWGTNGILTRIWFPLAPAQSWTQFTAVFSTYLEAFRFTQSIAVDSSWTKRLATVFEWPIPSFFAPIRQIVREGKSLALLMIESSQAGALHAAAELAGGEVTFAGPFDGPRTQPLLSDYTWNHTTLWAMKAETLPIPTCSAAFRPPRTANINSTFFANVSETKSSSTSNS